MKSLYTVNKKIKEIEDYERTNPCKQPSMFEASMTITYNQLKTIKKDLEVLGIIKNKKVEVLPLWYIIKTNEEKDNEYILMKYNERFGNQMYELTLEELLKLKQWLEENENDN